MLRFGFRLATWAFGATLLTSSCVGGQTGQPDSQNNCGGVSREASERWGDTTIGDAAEAFVGTYEARLRWQQEPLGKGAATSVELDDSAALALAYEGAAATERCDGQVRIPIGLILETTTSGISEHGDGDLVLSSPSEPLAAALTFRGVRVELDVSLVELSADVAPDGGFNALDPRLPGAAATFSPD